MPVAGDEKGGIYRGPYRIHRINRRDGALSWRQRCRLSATSRCTYSRELRISWMRLHEFLVVAWHQRCDETGLLGHVKASFDRVTLVFCVGGGPNRGLLASSLGMDDRQRQWSWLGVSCSTSGQDKFCSRMMHE